MKYIRLTLIGITAYLISFAYQGCTLTPEQAGAYAKTAHTVIQGGLQDYKEIKPLIDAP